MLDKITHTIEPVYDENSKILILGTMPSPKSREVGFTMDILKTDFGLLCLRYFL